MGNPQTLSRDQYLYLAKLAEQAERYDEMGSYMESLILSSSSSSSPAAADLSVEERNLFSVAYKNMVASRRAAWRIVSSIEQKEEGKKNEENVKLVKDYRGKIEAELEGVCKRILGLLEDHLVPSAVASEARVFYLKMKGDYYRYLAEFKVGDERKEAADQTMEAYKKAQVKFSFSFSSSMHNARVFPLVILFILYINNTSIMCSHFIKFGQN